MKFFISHDGTTSTTTDATPVGAKLTLGQVCWVAQVGVKQTKGNMRRA